MLICFPMSLFMGDQLGIIDFYRLCRPLAYDLAICLNSWCFDADGSWHNQVTSPYSGLWDVNPLSRAEIDAVPVLCAGSSHAVTTPADALAQGPNGILGNLQFHQSVSEPGGYGFD